jgi:predicted GIY-YIG superfamily endonuclease
MYIFKCNDGTRYVGHTNKLKKRLHEHFEGLIRGFGQAKCQGFNSQTRLRRYNLRKHEALA